MEFIVTYKNLIERIKELEAKDMQHQTNRQKAEYTLSYTNSINATANIQKAELYRLFSGVKNNVAISNILNALELTLRTFEAFPPPSIVVELPYHNLLELSDTILAAKNFIANTISEEVLTNPTLRTYSEREKRPYLYNSHNSCVAIKYIVEKYFGDTYFRSYFNENADMYSSGGGYSAKHQPLEALAAAVDFWEWLIMVNTPEKKSGFIKTN